MDQFVLLFTGMGIPCIVFLSLGIVLLLIEAFMPGFGVFGFSGIASLIIGIVCRIIDGTSILQILYLVLMLAATIGAVFVLALILLRCGILSRTPIVQRGVAVPKNYSDPNAFFGNLMGKLGEATTECHPVGKAKIDGKEYNVLSDDGFIIEGADIVVTYIEGDKIFIKKQKSI